MAITGRFMLLVCVGLLVIQTASAMVTCYKCDQCSNDFKIKDLLMKTVNCTLACGKEQYNQYVNRGCSDDYSGSDVCESKTVDGYKVAVCSCITNYCNSASAVEVSMATVLVFAFTAFVQKLC